VLSDSAHVESWVFIARGVGGAGSSIRHVLGMGNGRHEQVVEVGLGGVGSSDSDRWTRVVCYVTFGQSTSRLCNSTA
jgi:hypothetical protein